MTCDMLLHMLLVKVMTNQLASGPSTSCISTLCEGVAVYVLVSIPHKVGFLVSIRQCDTSRDISQYTSYKSATLRYTKKKLVTGAHGDLTAPAVCSHSVSPSSKFSFLVKYQICCRDVHFVGYVSMRSICLCTVSPKESCSQNKYLLYRYYVPPQ